MTHFLLAPGSVFEPPEAALPLVAPLLDPPVAPFSLLEVVSVLVAFGADFVTVVVTIEPPERVIVSVTIAGTPLASKDDDDDDDEKKYFLSARNASRRRTRAIKSPRLRIRRLGLRFDGEESDERSPASGSDWRREYSGRPSSESCCAERSH